MELITEGSEKSKMAKRNENKMRGNFTNNLKQLQALQKGIKAALGGFPEGAER